MGRDIFSSAEGNDHEMKVRTLEEKVEVLEKQIGDKNRKKRKIRSPSCQGAGSQCYSYVSALNDIVLYYIKTLGGEYDLYYTLMHFDNLF